MTIRHPRASQSIRTPTAAGVATHNHQPSVRWPGSQAAHAAATAAVANAATAATSSGAATMLCRRNLREDAGSDTPER